MKPIHALLAGVTKHYSQYLSITLRVFLNKNKIRFYEIDFISFLKKIKGYLALIAFYRFLATLLTSTGQQSKGFYSNLILVPIIRSNYSLLS